MSENLNRRGFLKKSIIASTGAALGLSFEEKALLAKKTEKRIAKGPDTSAKGLPMGKIGNLKISRLICGGNLISGFAHSRDLIYVSESLKAYHTDEKIMETFEICEETGINSAVLRLDDDTIRILNKYRNERGGKIQWIAQVKPKERDLTTDAKRSIHNGAVAIYIQGGVGDKWVKHGRVDLIGKVVSFIKENGLVAGVGGHSIEVPIACEKAGIDTDFYMKTLHSANYWSYNPAGKNWGKFHVDSSRTHDNVWCTRAEETIEFMRKVKKPWIAYKVLAAGAIHPTAGFRYAFENGADFACVGMFDFQVREDVIIAKDILSGKIDRQRPWRG